MPTLVLSLILMLEPGAAATRRPAPAPPSSPAPTIDWPDFFASVSTQGVVFSERLKALDGRRVRIRGFAVAYPTVPGGLLLSKDPFSDPHAVEETDLPFDAVGILWKPGLRIPAVPARPTVEGVLRLGNRKVGDQIVAIVLDDAAPVYPAHRASGRP